MSLVEEIDRLVVRTGVSDAGVTLTLPQVYNLARLLDIVQQVSERAAERNGDAPMTALPRAQAVRVE